MRERESCSSASKSSSSSTWWSNFCSSALRTKPQVSPSENSVRVAGDGLVRRLGLLDLVGDGLDLLLSDRWKLEQAR